MLSLRPALLLGLAAALVVPASAGERNVWPVWVGQTSAGGRADSWQGAGPLFFSQPAEDGETASGLRPVYVQKKDAAGRITEAYFLYPLFTYRADGDFYRWSIFDLINGQGTEKGAAPAFGAERGFDVWPFYFSRDTGDPATNYHALFPLAGTIKQRFGYDRISWFLFPFYGRFEKRGQVTITAPWPFVKMLSGDAGQHGLDVWPLFGRREQPGVYRRQFWLWPLIYKNETNLAAPQPDVQLGFLPFYARDTGPGLRSETWLWPFFGYTHRTAPARYDERRYFWPLFVQGRGDGRYVNRWAPIYTHSIVQGYDKTWVLWPLLRDVKWREAGLDQEKTQLLYFLFWTVVQRSAANPALAPAYKTHLWPLFSAWSNGAGRRQVQVLSPLAVFFPGNEPVRLAYNPLFALYRYDRSASGAVRQSFLFDFITWRRTPAEREFHLGPLLSVEKPRAGGERIAFGCGLFGLRRPPGARGWRPFLFDFHPARRQNKPVARP